MRSRMRSTILVRNWCGGCWNTKSFATRRASWKSGAATGSSATPGWATICRRASGTIAEEPIHEVELWDLVSAFGLIVRDTEASKPSNIVYDDTPIHVFMERIYAQASERGHLNFHDLFQPGMHKSTLVGIFLAVLELVRHHRLRVEQNELFGEIWLFPRTDVDEPLDLSSVDNYDHAGKR